jgi:ribosomal protein S18 acetylase RimI-like enzyme
MDDATLRRRLWDGFARLQALLGGSAKHGVVLESRALVASIVPHAPDSPALNAAVALDAREALQALEELAGRYSQAGVRRWGVWLDGDERDVRRALQKAGLSLATASPGMAATLDELDLDDGATARPSDLRTVGRVNDQAYGNVDSRLERTLSVLPPQRLRAYRVDLDGKAAAVALALHHGQDCGVSFVATIPAARRRGLATSVMHAAMTDARRRGCTTVSLQATDVGERLYARLGFRRLGPMELWERRQ